MIFDTQYFVWEGLESRYVFSHILGAHFLFYFILCVAS